MSDFERCEFTCLHGGRCVKERGHEIRFADDKVARACRTFECPEFGHTQFNGPKIWSAVEVTDRETVTDLVSDISGARGAPSLIDNLQEKGRS